MYQMGKGGRGGCIIFYYSGRTPRRTMSEAVERSEAEERVNRYEQGR